MYNCQYKATPCTITWICPLTLPFPKPHSAIPSGGHNMLLCFTLKRFLQFIIKVAVGFTSLSITLIMFRLFQNYTGTGTNKKSHVRSAITYYLLVRYLCLGKNNFDSSLLPDTPKTTLIMFRMCIILYNLACIFTFTILFGIINDHNYWVKWLVGTISYSPPFHRWEIKLWKLDYKS